MRVNKFVQKNGLRADGAARRRQLGQMRCVSGLVESRRIDSCRICICKMKLVQANQNDFFFYRQAYLYGLGCKSDRETEETKNYQLPIKKMFGYFGSLTKDIANLQNV